MTSKTQSQNIKVPGIISPSIVDSVLDHSHVSSIVIPGMSDIDVHTPSWIYTMMGQTPPSDSTDVPQWTSSIPTSNVSERLFTLEWLEAMNDNPCYGPPSCSSPEYDDESPPSSPVRSCLKSL
jgi:hypothetical protein